MLSEEILGIPDLNNLGEGDGHTPDLIISTSSLVHQQLSDAQVREEYAKLLEEHE